MRRYKVQSLVILEFPVIQCKFIQIQSWEFYHCMMSLKHTCGIWKSSSVKLQNIVIYLQLDQVIDYTQYMSSYSIYCIVMIVIILMV